MTVILKALGKILRRGANAKWFDKHQAFTKIAELGQAELVLIGDSITEGWKTNAASDIWMNTFEVYNTANFGIGGDRTHQIYWRLQHGEVGNLRPRLIILLAGTNNHACRESTAMILESFESIIALLQDVTPTTKILVLGILPTGRRGSRLRRQVLEVNTGLNNLCGNRGLTFLDCGDRFLDDDGRISRALTARRAASQRIGLRNLRRCTALLRAFLDGSVRNQAGTIRAPRGYWSRAY